MLEGCAEKGLKKQKQRSITITQKISLDCKLPPCQSSETYPEVVKAISEQHRKPNDRLGHRHNQGGAAVAAVGKAISVL